MLAEKGGAFQRRVEMDLSSPQPHTLCSDPFVATKAEWSHSQQGQPVRQALKHERLTDGLLIEALYLRAVRYVIYKNRFP